MTQLNLTEVQAQFDGETIVFSINGAGTIWGPRSKKFNLAPDLTLSHKLTQNGPRAYI